MKRLLSIFDYSGSWSAPYFEAGWDVLHWDLKYDLDVKVFKTYGDSLEILEDIDGILAAPPCTDFTVSGAQYWPAKDQDGRTAQSLALVEYVLKLANSFEPTCPDYLEEYGYTFFWCMENPVGRLPKLINIGNPQYFDPCDYAGYLDMTDSDHNELDRLRRKDGRGITWEEIEFIIHYNAYTKKTGLWGKFTMPEKKRIEPVRCTPQGSWTQRLGGKSDRTKELRSNTPEGFARAFYQSNKALTNYEVEELNA